MLRQHIIRSRERLSQEQYSSPQVWRPKEYGWPADWEGRALLALVCLNKIGGKENTYAHEIVRELPLRVNSEGILGNSFNKNAIDEQQLAGHGWLLRALIAYYKLYGDERAMEYAEKIVNALFLPVADYISTYPIKRETATDGGVSGHNANIVDGWRLSTDVGCIFIGIDGLVDYYVERPSEKIKAILDGAVKHYRAFDKVAGGAQTHATLTGARALMKLYKKTKDASLLETVKEEFDTYTRHGMTATYENFNWYGRKDTWTEPCAVVDSFILALQLFEETKDDKYRVLARRIWFCGLSFCHRINGGAGPNTCVTKDAPILKVSMWEAFFCCTMRYCEGLLFAHEYADLLEFDKDAKMKIEDDGRAYVDDVLLLKTKDSSIVKITDLVATEANKDYEYLVFWN